MPAPSRRLMNDIPLPLQEALNDRYAVERELGRGGMAVVYLARDLKHNRLVAIKLLRPEISGGLGVDRFLREIDLAAPLHHSHILGLIDSGMVRGPRGPIPYYVMPWVGGESLKELIQREHQLAVDAAVRIAHEVADALDYAHRHHIVHRDIKPGNILLADGHAMVADFGVAKALDLSQSTPGGSITTTGLAIGTPTYMSPEQAAADPHVDGRSDIYSLGAVLHEMLAGEPPFAGPTPQAVLARTMTGARHPLPVTRPQVTPELEAIVARALAIVPADRFQTAGAMRDALAHLHPAAETVTLPAIASAGHPRGLRRLAVVAALMLLAVLLLWRFGPANRSTPLDPDLVAIAPFDVPDPSLALWKEGVVDILARTLDGAGPLRTVAPSYVIRRWSGRADAASARRLGQVTGAQLVVYGSLLPAGSDSVRLSAAILDATTGRKLGDVERRDVRDHMDRLTDSVSVALLNELSRSRPIGAFTFLGIGASSFPALRAFLQGEQFFRQAEYDSSLAWYQRAIALDTAFALAVRGASWAAGWARTPNDSLVNAYAERAGKLNHGLSRRDSLLTAVDSLFTSIFSTLDSTSWSRRRRLFAISAAITHDYPQDAQGWYILGESRLHLGRGPGIDVTAQQVLDAFDRAIELDSSFAPAYEHVVELALERGGPGEALRYARAMARAQKGGSGKEEMTLMTAMLEAGGRRSPGVDSLIDAASPSTLGRTYYTVWGWPDSADVAIKVARAAARPASGEVRSRHDSIVVDRNLRQRQGVRGRLREACDGLHPRSAAADVLSSCVILGVVDSAHASGVVTTWIGDVEKQGEGRWLVWRLFPWFATQGDTAKLARLEGAYVRLVPREADSGDRELARYLAASAGAYRVLARSDTAEAIQRFTMLVDSAMPPENQDDNDHPRDLNELTLAQLLSRTGDSDAALNRLRHRTFMHYLVPGVLWELEHGHAADAAGEKAEAREAYRYVVDSWARGDPEVQPYVVQGRAGLTRVAVSP